MTREAEGPDGALSRAGRRLPAWARTVRVRLALTYSALLFAVAALLLGGVYLALSSSIESRPLDPVTVKKFERGPGGTVRYRPGGDFQAADIDDVQEYVNHSTLESLRTYSVIGLGVLFVLSLVIGWWVAGRALRPVGAITASAREISATDLSRRIPETGPDDELRNPVAVVQSNVDAVLARDDVTSEERAQAAVVVHRATGRMTRLLEDLLATARSRSVAFVDQPVDLSLLARQTVEEVRVLATERGLRLRLRLDPGPVVIADAQALSRAIGNLLSNAVRLAPGGSEVTIASGSRDGWAWLAVRDEGPGIAEEDRVRVFDRFGRPPEAPETGGHGLGLAIARQVVEAHEGRIALFSELGVGSTFVLWLPDRALAGSRERADAAPTGDPLGRR